MSSIGTTIRKCVKQGKQLSKRDQDMQSILNNSHRSLLSDVDGSNPISASFFLCAIETSFFRAYSELGHRLDEMKTMVLVQAAPLSRCQSCNSGSSIGDRFPIPSAHSHLTDRNGGALSTSFALDSTTAIIS